MQKYVVVTHLNRDTFIQQAIKEFNSSIEILFWEDIENECCTLEQKHTRSLFGDILEMCISFFQDNNKNEESEFYSLFVNLENELNDTDGYMISIETIAKIYRICNFISQRTITFTFQYQPQLLLCYQDLMVIAAFFQNTDIYQNRNSNYYIIDNLKVDCNRHEIIKSDFLELKNTFFSHSKSFLEAIAGKTFDNDSAYDQLDLSGLS